MTAPPSIEGQGGVIFIDLEVLGIPRMDEVLESMTLEVRLSHRWTDSRLNTTGLARDSLELEPGALDSFWSPDTYLKHAKTAAATDLLQPAASLTVYGSKEILHAMVIMVTFSCPMTFEAYPFDTQLCELRLQSFGYGVEYHNYTWERVPRLSGRVHLDNHKVRLGHFWFSRHRSGSHLPGLGLRLALQRKLAFHLSQTFLPSVILIAVAGISFFVPSDQVPGRLVLCITTLLTFTSMFNTVRSLTPQVAYMKAVDIWVLACLLFVFSCLAEYGLILHLTSRAGWQKRVDAEVRRIEGKERLSSVPMLQLAFPGPQDLESCARASASARARCVGGVAVLPPALGQGGAVLPPTLGQGGRREDREGLLVREARQGEINHKELLAYRIEYITKLAYPTCFLFFNLLYWSYYLNFYFSSKDLYRV